MLAWDAFDVAPNAGDKAFKASQTARREVIEARPRSLALHQTLMQRQTPLIHLTPPIRKRKVYASRLNRGVCCRCCQRHSKG